MGRKADLLGNYIRKLNGSCAVEGHGCHINSSESVQRSLDHRTRANTSEDRGKWYF